MQEREQVLENMRLSRDEVLEYIYLKWAFDTKGGKPNILGNETRLLSREAYASISLPIIDLPVDIEWAAWWHPGMPHPFIMECLRRLRGIQ